MLNIYQTKKNYNKDYQKSWKFNWYTSILTAECVCVEFVIDSQLTIYIQLLCMGHNSPILVRLGLVSNHYIPITMARNEEKQLARLNRYYLEKQKQGNLFFVCICMCLLEWESQLPACDPHICFLWHPYIINKITSKANRTLGLLCRTRTVEGLNSDRNMTKCSKQKANLASKIPGLHSKDRRATQNSSPFIILVLNTEQHKNSSSFFCPHHKWRPPRLRTSSDGSPPKAPSDLHAHSPPIAFIHL